MTHGQRQALFLLASDPGNEEVLKAFCAEQVALSNDRALTKVITGKPGMLERMKSDSERLMEIQFHVAQAEAYKDLLAEMKRAGERQ